jgi:hypothetical protein
LQKSASSFQNYCDPHSLGVKTALQAAISFL